MSEIVKERLWRFVIPIAASIISAALVGYGSTAITNHYLTKELGTKVSKLEKTVDEEKLLTRTISLETQIERHEKALERDFTRHEQIVLELGHKTEDQERRLTRLETLVSETQRLLSEISADVKQLLRGGGR